MPDIARRAQLPLLGDLPALSDWLDPFDMLTSWRRPNDAVGIRVETAMDDHGYTVRAELPGIDPKKDLELTEADGMLMIKAERAERTKDARHSEFRYGSYQRSVALPDGAKPGSATAAYKDGILTVHVDVEKVSSHAPRKITVSGS